jgi:pimeloyl-ACP methyl ester carboxylesterase
MYMSRAGQPQIYYARAGERGPCVLLVQGVGALGEGWRPQIDALGADHQLAWLDNRGIGRSLPLRGAVTIREMAADCLALLDHLGWQRAHLVGHSMGGIIVQEAARLAPSRVASLSLLSTAGRGRDVLRLSLSTLWAQLRMSVGAERSRWLCFGELAFPAEYRAALGEDAMLKLLRASFCEDLVYTPPIIRRQLGALFRHVGGDMSSLRKLPVLILSGAQDRVIATRYSDDLAAALPEARLVRFAGAGHGIIIQHADEVSQLLREHVTRHSP